MDDEMKKAITDTAYHSFYDGYTQGQFDLATEILTLLKPEGLSGADVIMAIECFCREKTDE